MFYGHLAVEKPRDTGQPLPPGIAHTTSWGMFQHPFFRTVRDTLALLDRHNIGLISAGIGFFGVLSIFPAFAAMVMVWRLVSDPVYILSLLDLARGVVPPSVFEILSGQVNGFVATGTSQTLGLATLVSIGFALWSARAGVAALIRGLNAVYQLEHRQTTFRRIAAALGLTLALCGAGFVAVMTIIIAPILLALIPLGPGEAMAAELTRWAIALTTVIFSLGIIYRYGPNLRGRRPGWVTPGALLATLLWLGMSWGFSLYLSQFANYNQVYGSIGAAIALMMWFYLSAYVVLLGATVNAAIARQRETDTQPGTVTTVPTDAQYSASPADKG